MDRINQIVHHRLWRENMDALCALERTREFCRHDAAHLLDVARLCYIESLETGLHISRDLIYAAALLHDIGRAAQYQTGVPHEQAGAELAARILPDCGFSPDEQAQILEAIEGHRTAETAQALSLAGLLYRADKASRACLFCPAADACNWGEEKKNHLINR